MRENILIIEIYYTDLDNRTSRTIVAKNDITIIMCSTKT